MTYKEAYDAYSHTRPSSLSKDEVYGILYNIDKKIHEEIIKTHEGYDGGEYPAKSAIQDNTMLIAPEPYAELYIYYVAMTNDLILSETARANNDSAMFNIRYQEYADWFNRNNLPIQKRVRRW